MLKNYHSHTARCGHAWGTDEEFIQAAIEAGFGVLGFSEHTPLAFLGRLSGDRQPAAHPGGRAGSLHCRYAGLKRKI